MYSPRARFADERPIARGRNIALFYFGMRLGALSGIRFRYVFSPGYDGALPVDKGVVKAALWTAGHNFELIHTPETGFRPARVTIILLRNNNLANNSFSRSTQSTAPSTTASIQGTYLRSSSSKTSKKGPEKHLKIRGFSIEKIPPDTYTPGGSKSLPDATCKP
jgi:hypothetical protein